MKTGMFLLPALLLLSLPAWADRNPDFNQDAKPILRLQPHLLDYVRQNFEVRHIGIARVPGADDRPPIPPFIFQARPRGSSGAYFITLLIQPGPQGRILKIIDSTQPHGRPPGLAGPSGPGPDGMPPPQEDPSPERSATGDVSPNAPEAAPASSEPVSPPPAAASTPPSAPSSNTPTGPTVDTPSGPISDGSTNTPSLAPPADPSP